jgi:diguanylate cyclase (GGDEF)-like protein
MAELLCRVALCLILAAPPTAAAPAVPERVPIHRLPLDGSLTQNSVTDMLQDRSGLMWFGTEGGLHVYDGYRFQVIPADPRDPQSLQGVRIARLFEDRDGHVWVAGTTGWLDRLDPATGHIAHLPATLYGPPGAPRAGPSGFHQDHRGRVYIATPYGLHRYDPATGAIETRLDAAGARTPLAIRDVVPAAGGKLWLGGDAGLFRFDPATRALEPFRHRADDARSLSADAVTRLHLDADGTLWVGTNRGLNRWDGDWRGFTRFLHDPADPTSLGSDVVWDILRDRAGRLWIGHMSGGLSLYDAGRFRRFLSDRDDPNSLSIDDVWSLHQDRSGLIWIGTAGGGLNQINPSAHQFQTLRAIAFNANSLKSAMVWDIVEDAQRRIWLATLAGLERYDPATRTFARFSPAPSSVAGSQMQALHRDRAGRFWAGSVDGHLYRVDPDTGAFTTVRHPQRADDRFSAVRVWYIGEGADGRLWISTADELVALDPETAAIVERFPATRAMPLGNTAIRTSLVDSDGVQWFGGGGAGLIRYAPGQGLTLIGHDAADPRSLSDNGVRSLLETPDGTLWIGTQNGLNRMSADDRRAARNRFALYTEAEGLPNNTTYGLLADDTGHLWIGTNLGLSRLDPATGAVRNFTSADGLVGNEMNGGAELVASDGTLYFGGVNGVSFFRPHALVRNTHAPVARITQVEVDGRALFGGVVAQRERVELDYAANDVTIAFAAMDFHQPRENRFRYRLAGQRDWIETDNVAVTLARLAPGEHRFEVHGSNNDGVWSAAPARLDIVVRPPWWRTGTAYALYAALLALAVLAYHRAQRALLRREREFGESLANAQSLAEAHRRLALRHAEFDELTDLPNRASLMNALERYLRFARAREQRLALVLVNLDRFQRINETLGHARGDAVLKATAQRLLDATSGGDFLARSGSDEFALVAVCQDRDDDGWPARVADALARAIGSPHAFDGTEVLMTASVGVAVVADDETADELLAHANVALQAAKLDGRNQTRRYAPGMLASARERLGVEAQMRRALAAEEFVLYYQPEVNATNGQLVGFEALIRWQSPDQGLLSPDKFIPVAEDLGLIVDLGRFVLDAACRQARQWLDAGHADFTIAVNVSASQLHHPHFVAELAETLRRHGVPASALELELTESAMMADVERVAATMRALKKLGVSLALDDFGVGTSSLSYLRRLPIDKLKIDRSFVGEMTERPDDAAIVRAVIAMAHQLQLRVVAEGVETRAQLGYLRRNHCDECQGRLLGMPQPPLAAERLLRQRRLGHDDFAATQPLQTLLLLDDEDNVRSALVRVLRRDGYRILGAANARDAFAILGREDVQVVVADQRMPDVSGTDFLNRVKEMYPDTVRLVLSGYTDLATVTDAINRGAIYKFLTKPWDDAELRAQVRDAFRMQAERKAALDGRAEERVATVGAA